MICIKRAHPFSINFPIMDTPFFLIYRFDFLLNLSKITRTYVYPIIFNSSQFFQTFIKLFFFYFILNLENSRIEFPRSLTLSHFSDFLFKDQIFNTLIIRCSHMLLSYFLRTSQPSVDLPIYDAKKDIKKSTINHRTRNNTCPSGKRRSPRGGWPQTGSDYHPPIAWTQVVPLN